LRLSARAAYLGIVERQLSQAAPKDPVRAVVRDDRVDEPLRRRAPREQVGEHGALGIFPL
jgi:hypothetical protein